MRRLVLSALAALVLACGNAWAQGKGAARSETVKVAFVDPTAKLVSNGVRVWATVKNEENVLRAGLPATMVITPSADLDGVVGSRQ